MRITQIDRILEIEKSKRIVAIKALSAAEEYLRDHFPRYPVMPGVLMLEAMFQASMWLLLYSEDFAKPMVVLREARNVKYADFVEPGKLLTVTAEIIKQDENTTSLKTSGRISGGEKDAVTARLVLERFQLKDRYPSMQVQEAFLKQELRKDFRLLRPETDPAPADN
ncbi:MAG: 3-hydroxyacyl-ACP dehydratase FabZ family protein [Pirellulaceae bacterium]